MKNVNKKNKTRLMGLSMTAVIIASALIISGPSIGACPAAEPDEIQESFVVIDTFNQIIKILVGEEIISIPSNIILTGNSGLGSLDIPPEVCKEGNSCTPGQTCCWYEYMGALGKTTGYSQAWQVTCGNGGTYGAPIKCLPGQICKGGNQGGGTGEGGQCRNPLIPGKVTLPDPEE